MLFLSVITAFCALFGCSNDGRTTIAGSPADVDCGLAYSYAETYFNDEDTLLFGLRVVYFSNTKDSSDQLPIAVVQERVGTMNTRYAQARIQFVLTEVINVYGGPRDNIAGLPRKKDNRFDIFRMSDYMIYDSYFDEANAITAYVFAPSGADIDASGIAGGIGSTFFAIRHGYFVNDFRTTEHEMGHCLGLLHIHQDDASPGFNPQTGDKVCDTPATINLADYVDKDCNIDESAPMPKGASELLLKNIMSYHRMCRNEFTSGQIERMRWLITQSPQLRDRILSRSGNIETKIEQLQ